MFGKFKEGKICIYLKKIRRINKCLQSFAYVSRYIFVNVIDKMITIVECCNILILETFNNNIVNLQYEYVLVRSIVELMYE